MTEEREAAIKAKNLAREVLDPAKPMHSSAALCLVDAERLCDDELYHHSVCRSQRSVQYSVGMFDPTYKEITALLDVFKI